VILQFYYEYIIHTQRTVRYVMKPPNHCLHNIAGVWLLSCFTVIYLYRYRREKCFENRLHQHHNNRDGKENIMFFSVKWKPMSWLVPTRIIFVKIKLREIIINTTTVFRIEFDFVLCGIVAKWIPTLTNLLDNTTDEPVHLNRPYLYII